jgi:hypothetical protein
MLQLLQLLQRGRFENPVSIAQHVAGGAFEDQRSRLQFSLYPERSLARASVLLLTINIPYCN